MHTDLAISKIVFQLGPVMVRWFAIIIVAAAALGTWIAYREAHRRHLTGELVIDYILWTFPLSIVGMRIYYVAFQWSYYSQHPSEIIAVWDGGIAVYGGLIAGAIIVFVFSHFRAINPLDLLDVAIPGVFIGQAIGRWADLVNQEAYGKTVSNLNWLPTFIRNQMYIDGAYRTPTFLYENIGTFTGFLIVMLLRHRLKDLRRGEIFGFYLIWYGLVRFIVEGMRTDSLMLGSLRVSQGLSLLLALFGLSFILYRRFKLKNIEPYNLKETH